MATPNKNFSDIDAERKPAEVLKGVEEVNTKGARGSRHDDRGAGGASGSLVAAEVADEGETTKVPETTEEPETTEQDLKATSATSAKTSTNSTSCILTAMAAPDKDHRDIDTERKPAEVPKESKEAEVPKVSKPAEVPKKSKETEVSARGGRCDDRHDRDGGDDRGAGGASGSLVADEGEATKVPETTEEPETTEDLKATSATSAKTSTNSTSCTSDIDLRSKLLQLECHFTWDLTGESADILNVQTRLDEQIKLCRGKKAQAIRSYCFLGYIRYLQGSPDDALKNLKISEDLGDKSAEDLGDKSARFLIVTYANLAWLHYHRRSLTECESYLAKLEGMKGEFSTASLTELHPEVYGQKGWAYLKFAHKYYGRAEQCFEKAVRLERDDSEWNAGYAIVLYRKDKSNREELPSVRQLQRAIELNPEDAVLKLLLGLKLRAAGSEVDKLIKDALDQDPSNHHVIRYAGKYYRQSGFVGHATTLFQRALQYTPDSAFIHHQLALCYKEKRAQLFKRDGGRHQGDEISHLLKQGIHHLKLATTLNSYFILAMAELALHYGLKAKYEKKFCNQAENLFQDTFKAAKESQISDQIVHHYYGEFQEHQKKNEKLAIAHYKKSLTLGLDTPAGNGSAKALEKMAKKRQKINPSDGEAFGILGFVHRAKGEKDRALECYEKALQFDFNNAEYLSALCDLRLSLQSEAILD
ncbi:interferon-induced protein with tetratricopeptide repeats 5-like isoform X2 [Sardina pilchardus]|uniref:interferon-induced protein with tetratricopeptide repeats 5-like isoform X2 n=1 Tax=Sardina pilchardus TaxID=27697 RepID=UPI002E0E0476